MNILKKIFSIITALLILLSCTCVFASPSSADFPLKKGSEGDLVVLIQQRLYELGYLSFRATGRYGDMTHTGVFKFQQNNGLPADGICGENTYNAMFKDNAKRNAGNKNIKRVFGPLKNAALNTGVLADWSESISSVFTVGMTVKVTDFNTGKTFNVKRTGGVNHANVEIADSASVSTYKTVFGGANTWERRAVLVEINGTQYAASLAGYSTLGISSSGVSGTVDMYFWGSYGDFVNLKDVEHGTACKTASGQ